LPISGGVGDSAAIVKEYITNGTEMTDRVTMFLIDVPVRNTAIKQANGFAILDSVTDK
jgi:hypothetical protein